jgi:type II restriction enzyme
VTVTWDDFDDAVRAFWTGRDLQAQRQAQSGVTDAGTRGAVTGGGHLGALEQAVMQAFEPLQQLGATVTSGRASTLPGFFRRSKDWDVVITFDDVLVAAVEFKSQVGSVGNNFNNRVEESIGNAVDLRTAFREGRLGTLPPWLAFVFVSEISRTTTALTEPRVRHFAADPIFARTSYLDRYQILAERLVAEGLYDVTTVIETERGQGIGPERFLHTSVSNLIAAIGGRVTYLENLLTR